MSFVAATFVAIVHNFNRGIREGSLSLLVGYLKTGFVKLNNISVDTGGNNVKTGQYRKSLSFLYIVIS